jgi:hypothetical protein
MDFLKHDESFRYRLLSRLQNDCEYFLGWGNRCAKHLWSGNVKDHIKDMKALYNSLKEKPEWLSWEQILKFEKEMA